jgi:Xaa-Pro aminopeptidase
MTDNLHTTYTQRWQRLGAHLAAHALDIWLQPVADEFQGEYPAAYAQRLHWLCGFTGSAGLGAVSQQGNAELFVDGRYTVQARNEVPAAMPVHLSSALSVTQWLESQPAGMAVGYDAWLHTIQSVAQWHKALPQHRFVAAANAIDAIWADRPAMPHAPLTRQPETLSGVTANEKIAHMCDWLSEQHADGLCITAPDAIMWLLNIRGADIDYNPLALCYALLTRDGAVSLYLHECPRANELGAYLRELHVSCHEIGAVFAWEHNPFIGMERCIMDPTMAPQALAMMAEEAGCHILHKPDPTVLAKAQKNDTELAAIRDAHQRDGLAVCKFLRWFYQQTSLSELDAVAALEGFRREDAQYRGPSFPTIAGAGAHGAIVHYRATEASNAMLQEGALLLVDSGGQYPGGTTDITRTMVLGTPSAAHKEHYTRVLKGHVALSMARFPMGVTGHQLDPLARQYLWQAGLDYNHGTGHGVGAYLCVHEGPQSISKRASNVALMPGMVLSNEPGYYQEGSHGIRIENLIVIIEIDKAAGIYGSEALTLAPYDKRLIDTDMLSPNEMAWLRAYHQRVYVAMKDAGAESDLLAWIEEEIAI